MLAGTRDLGRQHALAQEQMDKSCLPIFLLDCESLGIVYATQSIVLKSTVLEEDTQISLANR